MKLSKTKHKRNVYIPSSFAILFFIMLIFVITSWVGNIFNHNITKIGILDIFPAIWKGFIAKADVILFIFAIGGTLGVMTKLKAIDAALQALVTKLKNREWMMIVFLMIIFGLNGSTYGMWEETIAFFPILIPIFVRLSYGPFVGVATILIGAGTGVLASTTNPFSIGTATDAINAIDKFRDFTQGIGQLQRWISFVIFQTIAIILMLFIAKISKKHYGKIKGINNQLILQKFQNNETIIFTTKRKIVLILFISAFVIMIIGLLPWESFFNQQMTTPQWVKDWLWWLFKTDGFWDNLGSWTFISSASVFLILTIVIFAIANRDFVSAENSREHNFMATYVDGIKEMIMTALLIAMAAGLGIILSQTNIGKLIAQAIAPLASGNLIIWGVVVFIISLFLGFLVPSTSGFATAFIGIFATSIALGTDSVKQNSALALTILAFIMAVGIINLFSPSSASLMAYIHYAKIPYTIWIRQTYFVDCIYFVVAIIILVIFGAIANYGIVF